MRFRAPLLFLLSSFIPAQAGLVFSDGSGASAVSERPEAKAPAAQVETPVAQTPVAEQPDFRAPVPPMPSARALLERRAREGVLMAEGEVETANDGPRPVRAPRNAAVQEEPPPVSEEFVTPQGAKPKQSGSSTVPQGEAVSAEEPSRAEGEINAAFPYTHLLPSPVNLPGGTWVLGTTAAVGVTDFLQLSTNLVRDAFRYWNVSAKVPLIEYPTFIASAFVNFDSFNLRHFDNSNPDLRITTWQPGLVTGYEVGTDMAIFLGGNFNASKKKIPDVRTSGYTKGAQIQAEWSYLYNPRSSRLKDNAVSAGVNYDITYGLWGIGATHHWATFDVGFHYMVNANNDRFLPIVAFTAGYVF